MLVKLGNTAVINIVSIEKTIIKHHREPVPKTKMFEKQKFETSLAIEVFYTSADNAPSKYTLYGFDTLEGAQKVRDELLTQAKELEMEKLSTILENAITRN